MERSFASIFNNEGLCRSGLGLEWRRYYFSSSTGIHELSGLKISMF
jgi:hypothetical protein